MVRCCSDDFMFEYFNASSASWMLSEWQPSKCYPYPICKKNEKDITSTTLHWVIHETLSKNKYICTRQGTQLQYRYKGKLLLWTKYRDLRGRGGLSLCDDHHEATESWNRPVVAVTTPRGCYYRKPSNEEMTLKHRISWKYKNHRMEVMYKNR